MPRSVATVARACGARRTARDRPSARRPSCRPGTGRARPRDGRHPRTAAARPPAGSDPPGPRTSPSRTRTRSGGGVGTRQAGQVEDEHRRVRDDRDLVTGQVAEQRQHARPATGRRTAPSSTSTANGGNRCSADRWRASEARKSRRSLLDRPVTTTPRTPMARARVSVSASTRDPTTRIAPAEFTLEPTGAQLALRAALEPPARRPTERHDPAEAAAGGPDRDRGPGPDLADDPGDRDLEWIADRAARDAPPAAPLEHELASVQATPGPVGRARPAIAGSRVVVVGFLGTGLARRRQVDLLEAPIPDALGDGCPDHDRVARRRPAADRPARGGTRHRPARR